MPPAYVDPCRGHFPHRQAAGCCPIQIVGNNRVVTDGARNATTGQYIPLDICHAVDRGDLQFLNKVDHADDVGYDYVNATVEDLMDAAQAGVADAPSVMAELGKRVPRAGDADSRVLDHHPVWTGGEENRALVTIFDGM